MNKMKMSMIIFLVCALSSVFFACQTAFADDYGDNFSQATFTSVGTSISGSINPSGDIDYFAFTVNQTAIYVIYTRGITDTLGELYDANYSRLEYDRYSGEDDNFRIERSLTPGTYYMMVKGGSSYTTGNYELHLEGPEAGTVSDDHGFSPWSASAITVGSITDGSIDIPDDRDYFAFTVNQTAIYVIYTRGITDTLGELYDANYSRLEYDRYSGEDDNFRIERSLTPGTYYVMVKGGSSYTTGNYELHLEGPEAGTVSDDHGFSPWSASAITVGSITDGSIDIPDDRDYFAFTVNQTAIYVIYTRGITDTLGELYDANYSRLKYDRYSGEDDNFRIERSLTPGTYYVMVKGGSSYTTGNYELHLEGPEAGTDVIITSSTKLITVPGICGPLSILNWCKQSDDRNYLFEAMKKGGVPEKDLYNINWSGDIGLGASDVTNYAADQLLNTIKANHLQGHKVEIISHSWGTIIAYIALVRLSEELPGNKYVDIWITCGSPLSTRDGIFGPAGTEVKERVQMAFFNAELANGLSHVVSKPACVDHWYNYWSRMDMVTFPDSIPAANNNHKFTTGGHSSYHEKCDYRAKMIAQVSANHAMNSAPCANVPTSQTVYSNEYVVSPVWSGNSDSSNPIGVGALASGGDTLSLQIGTPEFSDSVDAYFAIFVPTLSSDILFLDQSGINLTTNPAPWKSNMNGPFNETIWGNISTSIMPPGQYTLFFAIAPAGSLENFYIWTTNFVIP